MNKKIVFMLSTVLFWFSLYAYVPELSTYSGELGAGLFMIGIITGSYGFTQLLLRIPLGIYSDTINKRKGFIIFGLFISAISSLVTFFFPSVLSLFMTRLLAGVSASTWIMFTVLFSSYFKNEESSKAIGIINSCNASGQLIGMLLGGFIAMYLGSRYLFLLGGIGAILGLILSIFIEEKPINRTPLKFRELLKIPLEGNLMKISILGITSQFVTFGTTFGFVPLVAENLGANSLQLSTLSMISVVSGIFVPTIVGYVLVKYKKERNFLVLGFLISSFVCLYIPFVNSLGALYICQFLGGIGRSMTFPLLMSLSIKDVDESKRATAMGFFQAIYSFGMTLGPIILGGIADATSLTLGFVATSLVGFISILIIYFVKDRDTKLI